MNTFTSRQLATRMLAIAALMLMAVSPSYGSFVTDEQRDDDQQAFAGNVDTNDLLTGLTGVHSGYNDGLLGSVTNLNNGVHGGDNDTDEVAWVGSGGAVSTWDLGVGPNGTGWNITLIRSIAAWDSGDLENQLYSVSYKPVGASGISDPFITLASVDYQPLSYSGSTQVTLSDNTSIPIANNVQIVRFNFAYATSLNPSGSTILREVDVVGFAAAAVPEPSAGLLGLMSFAAFLFNMRRRRVAG